MKSFLKKLTSTSAAAIVVFIGCVMAGLGMTVIAVLAMFALAVFGLAIIASPFVQAPAVDPQEMEQDMDVDAADEDFQRA
ncbi:MAG: hypothetical protein WA921_10005 [Ahrensia sp.]